MGCWGAAWSTHDIAGILGKHTTGMADSVKLEELWRVQEDKWWRKLVDYKCLRKYSCVIDLNYKDCIGNRGWQLQHHTLVCPDRLLRKILWSGSSNMNLLSCEYVAHAEESLEATNTFRRWSFHLKLTEDHAVCLSGRFPKVIIASRGVSYRVHPPTKTATYSSIGWYSKL